MDNCGGERIEPRQVIRLSEIGGWRRTEAVMVAEPRLKLEDVTV